MGHKMSNFYSYGKDDEIKCPVCEKMFRPAKQHAYYLGDNRRRLCCSYSCMRKWDKQEEARSIVHSQKRKTSVRIVETGETFDSMCECAEYLSTSVSYVYKCVKDGRTLHGLHLEKIEVGEEDD